MSKKMKNAKKYVEKNKNLLNSEENENQYNIEEKTNSDISDTEKIYTKEREWIYKGEVKGTERPKNSLLELEHLDCDPMLLVNEDNEEEIENLVRERLRTKIFDNLEPVEEDEDEDEDIKIDSMENDDLEVLYNELDLELNKISDFNTLTACYVDSKPKEKKKLEKKKTNGNKKALNQLKKFKNVEIMK